MHHTLMRQTEKTIELLFSLVRHLLEVFKNISRLIFHIYYCLCFTENLSREIDLKVWMLLGNVAYGIGYFSMQLNPLLDFQLL